MSKYAWLVKQSDTAEEEPPQSQCDMASVLTPPVFAAGAAEALAAGATGARTVRILRRPLCLPSRRVAAATTVATHAKPTTADAAPIATAWGTVAASVAGSSCGASACCGASESLGESTFEIS